MQMQMSVSTQEARQTYEPTTRSMLTEPGTGMPTGQRKKKSRYASKLKHSEESLPSSSRNFSVLAHAGCWRKVAEKPDACDVHELGMELDSLYQIQQKNPERVQDTTLWPKEARNIVLDSLLPSEPCAASSEVGLKVRLENSCTNSILKMRLENSCTNNILHENS